MQMQPRNKPTLLETSWPTLNAEIKTINHPFVSKSFSRFVRFRRHFRMKTNLGISLIAVKWRGVEIIITIRWSLFLQYLIQDAGWIIILDSGDFLTRPFSSVLVFHLLAAWRKRGTKHWSGRVIQERWLRSSLLSAIIPNYAQLIETIVAIWLPRDEIHDWTVLFSLVKTPRSWQFLRYSSRSDISSCFSCFKIIRIL